MIEWDGVVGRETKRERKRLETDTMRCVRVFVCMREGERER
jgi:hypothetical protein